MNYNRIIEYLFSQLAVYQRDGASAYKPGLDTSIALADAFENPQRDFPSVHIAGTNGKGSTAHTLAAIFQSAGYRTGLYTSPHLVDFRERIRVNGKKISKNGVIDFMNRYFDKRLPLRPSFFELTMTMAFDWFRKKKVDIAVIETGLGGRLDSTNIITPQLSIITNISYDHTALLGDTLPKIAAEKAGIIKPEVPVVIGEAIGEVLDVFKEKAAEMKAPMVLAEQDESIRDVYEEDVLQVYLTSSGEIIKSQLTGECQIKNARTVLSAVEILRRRGWNLPPTAVKRGFSEVCSLTGLMGRWTVIRNNPMVIADTGHNSGGWEYTVRRLNSMPGTKRLVIGFVNDKDLSSILSLVSRIDNSLVYATAPRINRALPASSIADKACNFGIEVRSFGNSVFETYKIALGDSAGSDIVFIGGSNFVVADFLEDYR